MNGLKKYYQCTSTFIVLAGTTVKLTEMDLCETSQSRLGVTLHTQKIDKSVQEWYQ